VRAIEEPTTDPENAAPTEINRLNPQKIIQPRKNQDGYKNFVFTCVNQYSSGKNRAKKGGGCGGRLIDGKVLEMGFIKGGKKFGLIIKEIDKALWAAIVDDPKIPARLASELGDEFSLIECERANNS